MSEDNVTRQEYQQGTERIHQRIDQIAETGIRIETAAGSMQKSVDKMCECIYGNGARDGLITKITRLFERVSLHTKIITGTLILIIGGFITMVFNLIKSAMMR